MMKTVVAAAFLVGLGLATAHAAEQAEPKLRTATELTQTTPEQQEALTEAFRVMAAHPECGIRIVYFEDGKPAALPDESPECLAARAKK